MLQAAACWLYTTLLRPFVGQGSNTICTNRCLLQTALLSSVADVQSNVAMQQPQRLLLLLLLLLLLQGVPRGQGAPV